MELTGALAAGVAVMALILALAPARVQPASSIRERFLVLQSERVGRARSLLEQARLDVSPRTYLALEIVSPLVLGWIGLLMSVPMAVLGLIVGALVPRWYVRYLVASEARAASDDAPRVLRAMVNRAASGGTYPDLYAAAAEAARHRWVKADFEEILSRYYAAEAPADALVEVRRRQAGRLRQNAGERRAGLLAAVFMVGGDEDNVFPLARTAAGQIGDGGEQHRTGGEGDEGESAEASHPPSKAAL